jgi:hypothetical protein
MCLQDTLTRTYLGQRSRGLGDYQFVPVNAQSSHVTSPSLFVRTSSLLTFVNKNLDVRELGWKSHPSP